MDTVVSLSTGYAHQLRLVLSRGVFAWESLKGSVDWKEEVEEGVETCIHAWKSLAERLGLGSAEARTAIDLECSEVAGVPRETVQRVLESKRLLERVLIEFAKMELTSKSEVPRRSGFLRRKVVQNTPQSPLDLTNVLVMLDVSFAELDMDLEMTLIREEMAASQ
ncbi:MAG: hypothetical protein KDD55_12235 [Bdellovibrionales bacterium]|nr:hypothetical protein [Bdellovibrionales bacterium]